MAQKYRINSQAGFLARHPRLVRWTLLTATFGASFVAGLAYAGWSLVCRAGECPAVEEFENYQPRQTSKLYAADGRFIAELGLERRTLLRLADMPPMLRNAFLVVEDKRFYEHSGIDWMRVGGAIVYDLRTRSMGQGFSTLTMQLARNIFPERISREKTPTRKLKEAKVARMIEAKYPKDRILELYMNQISLGNGAHGVETAAQRYFGKSAREVNIAEAATLAGLPKAPERYNPRKYPDRAVQRRNTVIELMRREGMISDADASLAKAYPLRLATKTESGDVAPYFVEWVRQLLDQQFGRQLYEQGLKVYTTLDLDLQTAAERSLERQLRTIEEGKYGTYRHQTYERYIAQTSDGNKGEAEKRPYLQGAFVAMDPRSGAVRAMVGGRDFDDSKFNRAVQAVRQPGSTFKPVVYAAAIQNGRPPTYVLDDSPLTLPMAAGDTWSPQNFDGQFEGQVTLRKALYESRNVPTVRLGMELGEQTVVDMGRKLGLSTAIPAYPSIHIGAAAVYPIEMVAAYSAFATLGMQARAMGIVRVENAQGEPIWSPETIRVPVLSPEEAWLMVDMMKDVVRRGTAAASVGAQFPIPSGGKTGTTNDYTDVWYIGYTSDLVAGVWIGMDLPVRIMQNAQGGRLAAPAWTAFMTEVYRRKPAPPDWPRPAGIVTKTVDLTTNTEWTPGCPGIEATEFFIAGTEPTIPCNTLIGLYPDTGAFSTSPGALPPPGTRDTMFGNLPSSPMGGAVVPGATPAPVRSDPRFDPRDTATRRAPTPPATFPRLPSQPPVRRDSGNVRVDSVKRGGVIIRRDTTRRDTLRSDTTSLRQQGRRRPPA
jgi:penicillin-binding protein 1A